MPAQPSPRKRGEGAAKRRVRGTSSSMYIYSRTNLNRIGASPQPGVRNRFASILFPSVPAVGFVITSLE